MLDLLVAVALVLGDVIIAAPAARRCIAGYIAGVTYITLAKTTRAAPAPSPRRRRARTRRRSEASMTGATHPCCRGSDNRAVTWTTLFRMLRRPITPTRTVSLELPIS